METHFRDIGLDFAAEVRARHAAGKSMRQTARELGCSQATVSDWSKRNGLVWMTCENRNKQRLAWTFCGITACSAEHARLWGEPAEYLYVLKDRYELTSAEALERLINRDPKKRQLVRRFRAMLEENPNAPESLFRRVLAESVLTV